MTEYLNHHYLVEAMFRLSIELNRLYEELCQLRTDLEQVDPDLSQQCDILCGTLSLLIHPVYSLDGSSVPTDEFFGG